MSKVTRKLQITIPKAIAVAHGFGPGSDLVFESAGSLVVLRPAGRPDRRDVARRVRDFDSATERQAARDRRWRRVKGNVPRNRGWRRGDLYEERLGARHVPR